MSDLERIEGLMERIKAVLEERVAPMPMLLTMKGAAHQLSVGMTKLRELVKLNVVLTIALDGRQMVPASEISRLCYVEPPRWQTPQATRLAAALAKIREPYPGGREALLKVRSAKRRTAQSQDFSELDGLLKGKKPKRKKR